MNKPIKRFAYGRLLQREWTHPFAVLHLTETKQARTSRVLEAKFNEDGTLSRCETLNSIYVQVKA